MSQPLINGVSYDWSQVEVQFSNFTLPMSGVSEISYSDDQEVVNHYGAGNLPVSRGFGNVTAEASISLHMEDIEQMRANVASGRLQDLGTFDVLVSFIHPTKAKIVTHTIKDCYLSKNEVSVSQGDSQIVTSIPLNPTHIHWNGTQTIGLGN